MNKYQEELRKYGFIRVDGILAYSYGDDNLAFIIPKPEDYPGKKFIVGHDFLFVFEKDSNETWYRTVDIKGGELISSIFYVGYQLTGEDDNIQKDGVNIEKTAFAHYFSFDKEMFEARKLTRNYCPEIPESVHSCESVLAQTSGDIAFWLNKFVNLVLNRKEELLKPLPNPEFMKVFGIKSVDEKKPILPGHLAHFYMLMILLSWRKNKFPHGLTYKHFYNLVAIPEPPLRCKD